MISGTRLGSVEADALEGPFCMPLSLHEMGSLRKDKVALLPPGRPREYFFGLRLTPQCQGAQLPHERFVIRLCFCTQDFVPNILLAGGSLDILSKT